MNKLGLKLWNINTENYFKEAQKLYQEGLFDYVELYIVPGHLDKLLKWKELNIPIGIHAPHFEHKMNLSKAEYFENNLKIYQEVKIYADELQADYIVFHSGTDGHIEETVKQLQQINDNRIVVENKPFKTVPHVQGDYYVGARIEEIKYAIDTLNCGFCLDIGHAITSANSFGINPYQHIKDFLKLKPKMFHLSDLDIGNEIDKHYNFGQGNLDFVKLFDILPENNMITIETTKKSSDNLDDFIEDVKFLRKIII